MIWYSRRDSYPPANCDRILSLILDLLLWHRLVDLTDRSDLVREWTHSLCLLAGNWAIWQQPMREQDGVRWGDLDQWEDSVRTIRSRRQLVSVHSLHANWSIIQIVTTLNCCSQLPRLTADLPNTPTNSSNTQKFTQWHLTISDGWWPITQYIYWQGRTQMFNWQMMSDLSQLCSLLWLLRLL